MTAVFVKGHALRQNIELIGELFGEGVPERVMARVSVPFRLAYKNGTLISAGWYPVSWANELHDACVKEFPAIADIPERVARLGVEKDMKGIYGFLARLVSPEFCIKQAGRILGTYFKGPKMSALILGKGRAELRFEDAPGISRLLWRDMIAGAQRVFEQAGARGVTMRVREGAREPDAVTVVEVLWS